MTKTLIAALLAVVFTGESLAQTTPATPTASQLELERARIEAQRKKMFDPTNPAIQGKKGSMPSGGDVEREMQKVERERKEIFDSNNPATTNAPNNFPNIATPERSNVDLEALARRYEQKAGARKTDGLMVFVSFTMPNESLKRLIADANRAGGVVVMRGFKDGSIKATALAIQALGEASGNVQINPNAFTKYRITAVPAVVLVKPEGSELVDNEGCALPDKYVMVAGDVGLSYALEEIERRSAQFQEMAARYGRPLKGRGR
jgi:conjugal transfer pilus assembly protein TrbC